MKGHSLTAILWAGLFLDAAAAQSFKILPEKVELTSPHSRQQLLAEAFQDGFSEDWTRLAEWTSDNPKIAAVDRTGLVRPVGDGETVIRAQVRGQRASVTVRVKGMQAPFTFSFRNHVIPVLTKAGCNQGACHGAQAGKNGFKLTLRGYDPELDYDVLTRQSLARRVSLAEPAASLILQKATFSIPHGGGLRFKKDAFEYRVIHDWIAAGAPPPSPQDAEVTELEVFPKAATLKPNQEQQIVVRAKYSDGRLEDVTHWVKFSSNNEGVALVDDSGKTKITGHGEAAITAWYASKIVYTRLTSPYPTKVSEADYRHFERRNFIDDLALAKWKSLNLAPSATASDSTFIRRAFLDAAGILPTTEEVEQFLAEKSPDKRSKLIDKLLEREEYVDYWAYKWSDLLLVSSRRLRPNAMWSFYNWIRDSVKTNKPWDEFARDIFTASGNTRQHGALNYFVLHKDPIDLTENVTQAFLGQRLTCARCHNHPLEKWTQVQYYKMANLFARIGIKNGSEPGESVVFAKTTGEVNHPRLLRPLPPTPLDGVPMPLESTEDRRQHFAKWLTSPQNPYFARAIVNRVWANFMGRGLVDPVDDVREANAASNEELFAALVKDFVDHRFDIKHLVRTIMNSAVYQLASEANSTNGHDNLYYSKYIVKRLPAEVILDAMSQVTGVPTPFSGYPLGTRALQLPDSQVASQFLTAFGRPNRIICDASERSSDPSIAQALHVINGDTLNQKLSASDGTIALFLKLGLSDARILEHIFLAAYSRYPTEAEKQSALAALEKARQLKGSAEAQREARRQALEDLLWAVLTSKEFLFNY
ncbi:MAG: DUF1553 domain-containing protein [Bryobacteraceae bacterium]|nr:DUF1553 domain-containing protein [Bryobacteraceae bacterium]MDW8378933.1 DUF1553 domain-containing protein [Bryobacterales bacterium]